MLLSVFSGAEPVKSSTSGSILIPAVSGVAAVMIVSVMIVAIIIAIKKRRNLRANNGNGRLMFFQNVKNTIGVGLRKESEMDCVSILTFDNVILLLIVICTFVCNIYAIFSFSSYFLSSCGLFIWFGFSFGFSF